MLKSFLLFSFLATVALLPALAQGEAQALRPEDREAIRQVEDTLASLSSVIFQDTSSAERFAATRDMIPALVRALQVPNSFRYRFERLPHVSIQYPADSSFRVFTWQLYVDKDTYRYYGAIQMNRSELQLHPLVDRSDERPDLLAGNRGPEAWYGAVYYRLQAVDSPQGTYYLLFGFDAYRFFRKRKIVDVLHFDGQGAPAFGLPVFVHPGADGAPDTTRQRLMLEYSSAATVRLNYDPALEMIVHDHLVTLPGSYGEGPVGLPDGSYEGYRLEGGQWIYVEKLWDVISEEAPRPFPVLDKRASDLFGEPRKKND